MKKNNQYILAIFAGLLLILSSCQEEYELGEVIAPSNIAFEYDVVGADDANPHGDGSGLVDIKATADNALSYFIDFGDGKTPKILTSGEKTHQFTRSGVQSYEVIVTAIGTAGLTASDTFQLEVLSTFSDPEAPILLTGGSSKSWYFAANKGAHVGVGPNDLSLDSNPDAIFSGYWWSAAAWSLNDGSIYDCELIFTLNIDTDTTISFEHKNPNGNEAYFMGEHSPTGERGTFPWVIEGINEVTIGPANSVATSDPSYRGTSISISGGGFLGLYFNQSEYEIIELTETELELRFIDGDNPNNAWYQILTTEKPVQ